MSVKGVINRLRLALSEPDSLDKPVPAGIDPARLPKHLAIIMDGNGRWATQRGLPRVAGHRAGVEALRGIVRACREWGIPVLTIYAFSTENWKRPRAEVEALMNLLVEFLRREIEELDRSDIQIRTIGRTEDLPLFDRVELRDAITRTSKNKGLILNLALNYGARTELVDCVKTLAWRVKNGEISPEAIDEKMISGSLYTGELPDPDLIVRTGGEVRLSNFLLWQAAYSEIWVTPVYWPDFRPTHLLEAIKNYQNRDRRFGGLGQGAGQAEGPS